MEGRHRSRKSSDKVGKGDQVPGFPYRKRWARVGGMEAGVSRTPEERLVGLPDFPFAAHYEEVDGLRLAYLDEGEGPPVVFFHGEPTWSFLWRKVIPPVRDAGLPRIAPDYPGFGRS